jgi:hypothetical protein
MASDSLIAPEPVTVTRWRCPFCHRSRSAKSATAAHIERCWLNPAVRSCKTCAHYEYEPPGDPCEAGRPCSCNAGHEGCGAGVDLTSGQVPRTGCPLAIRERSDA